METILIDNFEEIKKIDDLICTIGAYDGIHQGHKKIFQTMKDIKTNQEKMAVVTFNFHPDFLLNKRGYDGKLENFEEKSIVLAKYGFDYLIVLNTTKELLNKTYIEFNQILKALGAKKIVVGEDFKYGYKGLGNCETLKVDFQTTVVKLALDENEEKISSNHIRLLLEEGKVEEILRYTGSYYKIIGKVTYGKKIGSTIGFPTANIPLSFTKIRFGVYAVRVLFEDKVYIGIANAGTNPTIGDNIKPLLEVNIFDFDKDIYGKVIEVELLEFVRDQKRFENIDDLRKQIALDIEYIKNKYRE